ncbi:23S rRNA (guanine(745)-N(1))-methyltransferase [Clostridium frigidicarnis]|uniref:23S rRNA (Guanine745-N1)-methyltransferase n=1 Tax=Clostridium frigidicarnis TaxID=84698 RepID=A0A1I0ZTR8_9CLOT|nr:23S rRNA (guanine(745)-N(1))-methyltransferase [Clostridium frigidicarnis]SFB29055.1 23S rRNA (guanine745-N1)-methyltransferase [Clostridium frigidicarnis]
MKKDTLKTVYKCPVCGEQLEKLERQYVCEKNHSFDISGKSHVNLLLANQKNTKDPGDNKEMMENRRNFLNKGYYSKFSDELNNVIDFYLKSDEEYILDAGCGEGYFISKIKNKISSDDNRHDINYYGMDISKSAIKYATRRDKTVNFSVGSSFNLPFLDKSLNYVIRNFAPGEAEEFRRVLKDDGKLVIATPGVEHLFELKERIYENPRKHEIKDTSIEDFQLIDHREIKYDINLNNNEDIQNLITMTPYYWSITKEMKNRLEELESFRVTLHFNIDVYKKA